MLQIYSSIYAQLLLILIVLIYLHFLSSEENKPEAFQKWENVCLLLVLCSKFG